MPNYDPQNFESVLLHMREEYGRSVFRKPERMYAIISDLSPKMKPYGKVIRQLAESGALSELEAVRDDETRRDRALMKAREILENELLLSADRAEYFLGVLCTLYGIAPPTPQAQPTPEVKPTPQAQPAPPPSVKIVKSGKCGDNVTFTLDENGLLTISGAGPMRNFVMDMTSGMYDTPWEEDTFTISRIEIRPGVTTIGDGAFSGAMMSLKSVTIPDGVTTIGENAFSGCMNVTNITIPDSVTKIKGMAFFSCSKLASVVIPYGVTEIEELVFAFCSHLTRVDIPDSVKKIRRNAFANCYALTDIFIPDSVTTIGEDAFKGCQALKDVSVSGKTDIKSGAFPFRPFKLRITYR